jgi:hypothetical protein
MKSVYSLAKAKIRTNYDISESFPLQKGVLQGETVSPVLWDMYIEDLINKLDNSDTMPIRILGGKIHALLYVDDIVLLAYTPAELQRKIKVLQSHFKENELRINLGKTKYRIFWKKPCLTAAQDRKGLTPSSSIVACNMKLSFLLSSMHISMPQAP